MRKNDRLPALRPDDAPQQSANGHGFLAERGETPKERQVQREFRLRRLVADAEYELTAHVHQRYLQYQWHSVQAQEALLDRLHDVRAQPRINKAARSDIEDMIDHTIQDTIEVGLERGRILARRGNELLSRTMYPTTDDRSWLDKLTGK